MTDFKNYAHFYADLGFAVIPLRVRDKHPFLDEWQNKATSDHETIERWWNENPNYNIGFVTGAKSGGIVVVDLDQHPEIGKVGIDLWKEWEHEHGSFPETWEAVTGSGGRHIFFKDSSNPSRNQHLYHSSVDFQAGEALIVLPPSIHPDTGMEYFWDIAPEDTEIGSIDDNVRSFLVNGREADEQEDGAGCEEDSEEIEEGHRTDAMQRLIAKLRPMRISADMIKTIVRGENNRRCNPPLTDDELEKEVFPAIDRYEEEYSPYYKAFKMPETLKGRGRDRTLYKAVCSLMVKGYSEKGIRLLIGEENATRCKPPLQEDLLEKNVFSAFQKFKEGGRGFGRRKEYVRREDLLPSRKWNI